MHLNSVSRAADQPEQLPTGNSHSISPFELMQSELKSLRKAYEELQAALLAERRTHEMVREERDQYRRILYPPLAEKISKEELIHFAETAHLEPTLPLRDLLVEIGVYDNGRNE